MWQRAAGLVTPGNLEDDIDKLADCDWIVEAVLEDPEVKRDLYKRLESVRKDGSIVSYNTSTLPLTLLTEGLPERFAPDFLITHFFNPPRYLALLDDRRSVVTGTSVSAGVCFVGRSTTQNTKSKFLR